MASSTQPLNDVFDICKRADQLLAQARARLVYATAFLDRPDARAALSNAETSAYSACVLLRSVYANYVRRAIDPFDRAPAPSTYDAAFHGSFKTYYFTALCLAARLTLSLYLIQPRGSPRALEIENQLQLALSELVTAQAREPVVYFCAMLGAALSSCTSSHSDRAQQIGLGRRFGQAARQVLAIFVGRDDASGISLQQLGQAALDCAHDPAAKAEVIHCCLTLLELGVFARSAGQWVDDPKGRAAAEDDREALYQELYDALEVAELFFGRVAGAHSSPLRWKLRNVEARLGHQLVRLLRHLPLDDPDAPSKWHGQVATWYAILHDALEAVDGVEVAAEGVLAVPASHRATASAMKQLPRNMAHLALKEHHEREAGAQRGQGPADSSAGAAAASPQARGRKSKGKRRAQ